MDRAGERGHAGVRDGRIWGKRKKRDRGRKRACTPFLEMLEREIQMSSILSLLSFAFLQMGYA